MSELNLLLGPAIVAAVISGLVSLIVVQLNFRAERRAERLRREEKVQDFQIALRAEIVSDLINMQVADRGQFLEEVAASCQADPNYVPVIPQVAPNVIFNAIIAEIHVLPSDVIGPIVRYARLRDTRALFTQDMRSDLFRTLARDRQLLMHSDYLAMFDRLEALASQAHSELGRSLGTSSSDADPSSRSRAAAEGGASAGNSST